VLKVSANRKADLGGYTAEVQLVELDKLFPHEAVSPEHLKKLTEEIVKDGFLKRAIVVDKNTNVILDGEHRFAILQNLGCKKIPVVYVDYTSSEIQVESRNSNRKLTKKDVIVAGLSGKILPPKASKHMIRNREKLLHISVVESEANLPLDVLKSEPSLMDIREIKTAMSIELRESLPFYKKFLSTEIVDTPLIVDEKTSVLLVGYPAFQALDLLSAKKVPVFKADIASLKVSSQESNSPPITKELITEAGIKGPKLPPRSFKIDIMPFKIDIPLKEILKFNNEGKHRDLKVYNSPLELLYKGWPTPLVKLNSLSTEERIVWGKLEGYNPFSNSIKDRIGWAMIFEALEKGELMEALYEATSTNTGIAITSIANMLGLKTKLFIPRTIQKVSDIYLEVLGAEVVRLPVGLTVEAISQVDAEAKARGITHLNQFENDANFKVHLKTTAKEIDEQLESLALKPSCIIGGLGTSGHMSAVSYYFKTKYGNGVKLVGVQPAPNEVIPGIRRIETGMKWIHQVQFDKVVDVKQVEAIEGLVKVARKEGILLGLSAGAVVHAFQSVAEEKGVYVLIFPDTGYKYAEQYESYFGTSKDN